MGCLDEMEGVRTGETCDCALCAGMKSVACVPVGAVDVGVCLDIMCFARFPTIARLHALLRTM